MKILHNNPEKPDSSPFEMEEPHAVARNRPGGYLGQGKQITGDLDENSEGTLRTVSAFVQCIITISK